MALLQISEPGESKPLHTNIRLSAGIDLGTTKFAGRDRAQRGGNLPARRSKGRKLLPSVVHIDAEFRVLVGYEARCYCKPRIL